MSMCNTLAKVNRQTVDFDPLNLEHLRAYKMLTIGVEQSDGSYTVRQHPTLRFNVVQPFTNVRTMMTHMVSTAWIQHMEQTAS